MIHIKNPYTEQKRELIKAGSEDIDKINELERQSREFTQKKINELSSKIYEVQEKVEEIKESQYKITRQYKEMVELHRHSKKVSEEVRQAKKELIDEMNKSRRQRE